MEMLAVFFVVFAVIFYLAALGISVASYVLNSIALQRLAKRRQIRNPFLAWIPVASSWLIGSIADDFDAKSGQDKNWRKILLFVTALPIALVVLLYIVIFAAAFSIGVSGGYYDGGEMVLSFLSFFIMVPLMMVSTVQVVLNSICMYKIFESTVPEKSVKYLILYLLVPLAGPICLYKCKDLGYSNVVEAPKANY